MKNIISFVVFFFLLSSLFAQLNSGLIYYYNAEWKQVGTLKEASYFLNIVKENDSSYVCRYYYKLGPMLKFETYRDSNYLILNGLSGWYNSAGEIDSVGAFSNDKRDDYWVFGYNEDFSAKKVRLYNKGVVVNQDNNASTVINSYSAAMFAGGLKKFTQYLTNNIKVPEPFWGLKKGGNAGIVTVSMEIDAEGKVIGVFPLKSYEWRSDMEALRVASSSPRWQPAKENGKNVNYFHIQRIIFNTKD